MLPSLTTKQMREVDRIMVEEYGIGFLQMMEEAGRNLTEVARTILGRELSGKKIVVLVGPGNNGGGGMVAARHLANGGAAVMLILAQEPTRLREIPAHQYATLSRIGVRTVVFDSANAEELSSCLGRSDLVIDALLGYSLNGPPRGRIADDDSSGQWKQPPDPSAGSPVRPSPGHRGDRQSLYPGPHHPDPGLAEARTARGSGKTIYRPSMGGRYQRPPGGLCAGRSQRGTALFASCRHSSGKHRPDNLAAGRCVSRPPPCRSIPG